MVTDQNHCYLPVELQTVVASILREFPGDVVAHLDRASTSRCRCPLPKIVDMGGGTVTYDATIASGVLGPVRGGASVRLADAVSRPRDVVHRQPLLVGHGRRSHSGER
jgi:hypothetical protein